MGYSYDSEKMRSLMEQYIIRTVSPKEWTWLKEQQTRFRESGKTSHYNLTFTMIPRFVKKTLFKPKGGDMEAVDAIRKGLSLLNWTSDRLARAWWLLGLPAEDRDTYCGQISTLFKAAEMNEQIALYGALPLYAFPETFASRTSEGIRTNIGTVFEAIALDNPYAAGYLEEAAWNQLVLKAFFMDKPVNRIFGLMERANPRLAFILSDYAHERWAAGRPVNPWLWKPVAPFIDERLMSDIERLFASDIPAEKRAAALVSSESGFGPAARLLDKHTDLKRSIEQGTLGWNDLLADNYGKTQ